ncbi:MAG: PD-(D/E)XK nuclease family protein, partial [Bacteroidales bacterium]|nr:PD-(D/E)XK nuclease family protein [Bacteroidales bacterium]
MRKFIIFARKFIGGDCGMKHFLHRVAEIFFQNYTSEINRFTFVFPNRRAGLFFQQYLAEVAARPFFSPSIITIEQWFENASSYVAADKLFQLFRLYELFKKESNSTETFDSFAFWGEIILNDFNEVDKYLADAQQLFGNIADLKNIDEKFDYFSESQLEAIRSFWKNFTPLPDKKSQLEFLETWKVLHALYTLFRNSLKEEGLAYEGMMMREVVDMLQQNRIPAWLANKEFVFIGFNALNPCEKAMMTVLKKMGKADFYWDYEADTLQDPENPASRFFIENTTIFPSNFTISRENR